MRRAFICWVATDRPLLYPQPALAADHELLFSPVGSLLKNAFKFTRPHTAVTLNTYAMADDILFEVTDHCGGLSPGTAGRMFLPFTQERRRLKWAGLIAVMAQRRG